MSVPAPDLSAGKLPITERTEVFANLDVLLTEAAARKEMLALLVIQIRQLDEINQEFGYDVGDALVRAVSDTITGNKRPSDQLLRIGTDTLLLILPRIRSNGLPILAAQRILKHGTARLELLGRWLRPGLRVGVALSPGDASAAPALMRCADAALLEAKRLNQDITTYAEGRIGVQTTMLETLHDLQSAIGSGQLFCHFQPKVDLRTRRFVSVESLTRWQTTNGTMISPARFIPVAEESGLIGPLTFRSLNESVRECAEIQDRFPGLSVAVNLSTMVFAEPNLKDIIVEVLQIWRLPPELLVLEVTESALMHNVDDNIALLREFRDLGLGVSIDDFGTGYSSLSYLSRLPATEVKIDRSFVQSMMRNAEDLRLVRAIIDLADGFGLKTVAEGIEDAATLATLTEMGCGMAQGYFIARPMPADDLPAWFAQGDWLAPEAADGARRLRLAGR